MMKCMEDGKILLFLDDQLDPLEKEKAASHLAECPSCSQRLQTIKGNFNFAQEKMVPLYADSQTDAVRGEETTWSYLKERNRIRKREGNTMKFKKFITAAAVVLVLGAAFSIPSVQSAAAGLLQSFRMEKVNAVTITPQDMEQIQAAIMQGDGSFDIETFGEISVVGENSFQNLSREELADLSFVPLLPEELSEDTSFTLDKTGMVEITPRVEEVNRLLQAMGSNYTLPQAMDGQTSRVIIGDMLTIWTDEYRLKECESPVIEVPEGVDISEVARALVELPIWPEDVQRQLEAVNDWEHTLLLPLYEDSQKVTVSGQDAILMNRDQYASLIWQQDGILFFLESDSPEKVDLTAVAQSLR